ncbi:MAG TPA: acyl carrier protein [Longimicrobiales bacterium]|nr:acyl carrier protein [Longimicrobiales bacterium]
MSATRTPFPPLTRRRLRFVQDTAAWVVRRFAPGSDIGPDTPLFEGLIDSIRILELIAWTEQTLDRRIPDRMIRMDHFRTLRAVAETFIPEDDHVER